MQIGCVLVWISPDACCVCVCCGDRCCSIVLSFLMIFELAHLLIGLLLLVVVASFLPLCLCYGFMEIGCLQYMKYIEYMWCVLLRKSFEVERSLIKLIADACDASV